MSYKVTVKDIAERRQIIATKCTTARREPFYQLASGVAELPVIDLDINLPVYRLENYRTQTRQMNHIRVQQLPPEFFKSGEENVTAQQAQHPILLDFAKQGSGESVIPIYDVLQKGRQQNEPLLLTTEGVVVNGNRRLAAMRQLYASDPEGYKMFASVRAKVLPAGLTKVEIKRIEARLQMTPQTLLPYDWVNEALAIRDLHALQLSDAEIAAEMKLDGPEDVQEILERLAEAELFLNEYLKAPLQYEKVMPHKQQFLELQKALDKTDDAVKKELARKISYVLTHNSEDLGRRAYDYRIAYGTELDKVVEQLSDRLGVEIPDDEGVAADDDLLSDGSAPVSKFSELIARLNDVNQSKAIASEIAEICNNIREGQQKHSQGQAALQKAVKAHTLLAEISLETAAENTLPKLEAQLQSISKRAADILNAVKQRQQSP